MADAVIAALPNTHVLFTTECVCDWHPDKVCDRVAEAVVDALLTEDPHSKANLQVLLKSDLLLLLGSVVSPCQLPYEQLIRRTLKKLSSDSKGLGTDVSRIVVNVEQVAPEAASKAAEEGIPGDIGVVAGYASGETQEGMPLAQVLASRLSLRLFDLSRSTCLWVRSETHLQLTFEYKRSRGKFSLSRIHTVLVSADSETSAEDVKTQLREEVVKPIVPEQYLDDRTVYVVTPVGRCGGVSGRRGGNFYGGWGDTGNTPFPGKDPSKIERYGPLASRWIAKSMVKSGLCERVLIHLAYSGSQSCPLSLHLDSFGTSKGGRDDKDLAAIVLSNFDLRSDSLIQELNLRRGIYEKMVSAGPFGREEDEECAWERPKEISNL